MNVWFYVVDNFILRKFTKTLIDQIQLFLNTGQ